MSRDSRGLGRRVADIERHETVRGALLLGTMGAVLVLVATLYRKGILKPGDLIETLTADA